MKVADSLLPFIQILAGTRDTGLFVSQYRRVLKILDMHFDIPVKLWPAFITGER
jgi:hypothetical protein